MMTSSNIRSIRCTPSSAAKKSVPFTSVRRSGSEGSVTVLMSLTR